ncbi:hypothetical protein SteCoe_10759 [Stentor coeruleus]|uniref:Protein kinase domain-containing protein n=1 Tax=Stentor coeruleus TaxID=5963 RepID=A0A1R2CEY4_9CILI|nr:hypothetical protein SteCoe_10759 [Stentor coeruleus]
MLDGYTVKHTIAVGEHSKAKLVQDRQGKYFCAKIMYYKNESSKKYITNLLSNELKSFRVLTDSKTIQIVAASFDGKYLTKKRTKKCVYLLSVLCIFGPLSNLISLHPNEGTCRYFFSKILSAIDSIHNQGIVHLNIKLENVLLDSNLNIKLCGFSLSSQLENGKISRHSIYTAPEILAFKQFNGKKADIFALGVLMFIFLCGSPPFFRASYADTHYKMLQTKKPAYWNMFSRVSDDFKDIIVGMLKDNPGERYDLDMLKTHKWTKTEVLQEDVETLRSKLLKSLDI